MRFLIPLRSFGMTVVLIYGERETGFEPATPGLGSQRSAN